MGFYEMATVLSFSIIIRIVLYLATHRKSSKIQVTKKALCKCIWKVHRVPKQVKHKSWQLSVSYTAKNWKVR